MAIEARLPDGTTLQFPDGTPDAVVDGAVKQHLSGKPADASQTPESKLGLTPAPPEKPKPAPVTDPSGGSEFGEGGAYSWTPTSSPPGVGSMGLDTSTEPRPGVAMMAPLSRDPQTGQLKLAIPGAVRGIYSDFPQFKNDELTVPGATLNPQTGTYGVTPEAAGAASFAVPGLRFGGRPPSPPWMPEATLGPGASTGGPAFLPPGTLRSVQLNQLLDAIGAVDQKAANKPPFIPPTTSTDVMGNVTPIQQPRIPAQPPPAPAAPPPSATPASASPAAPAVPGAAPVAPSPDPAIMTTSDMRARSGSFFDPADQAATAGAMLPDANAAAVRKLFRDTIPSDPERARINADQPAVQAAKNVAPDGPMSFATAMDIDRNLTGRLRGASGEDAHDLSQLQQALRAQMDQVPDLDNLRPARQAYKQYIKSTQMDDIDFGASLKNDPAAQNAYVQQRAAALLKNDSAMRNWTPEEKATLQQVAQSGDIGMLRRVAVSLVKPSMRAAGAAGGYGLFGPLGGLVGAEVGGDVGATQAAKLRAYFSQTTLDPVREMITRGVPPAPPNQLGP